jgi:hypothetical protein
LTAFAVNYQLAAGACKNPRVQELAKLLPAYGDAKAQSLCFSANSVCDSSLSVIKPQASHQGVGGNKTLLQELVTKPCLFREQSGSYVGLELV